MEVLWACDGQQSVRQVFEQVSSQRPLAYTTVMTVLDRLAKKALVTREQEGRAWLYRPALSRTELYAGEIAELFAAAGADAPGVLTQVVAGFDPAMRATLHQLGRDPSF